MCAAPACIRALPQPPNSAIFPYSSLCPLQPTPLSKQPWRLRAATSVWRRTPVRFPAARRAPPRPSARLPAPPTCRARPPRVRCGRWRLGLPRRPRRRRSACRRQRWFAPAPATLRAGLPGFPLLACTLISHASLPRLTRLPLPRPSSRHRPHRRRQRRPRRCPHPHRLARPSAR